MTPLVKTAKSAHDNADAIASSTATAGRNTCGPPPGRTPAPARSTRSRRPKW
ncbi:hypothetical protein I552_5238 [Mycobacterium xenopi 3993]|nr:hypothetical protein I552_5238 [Mycobacterium xenopi 3993]